MAREEILWGQISKLDQDFQIAIEKSKELFPELPQGKVDSIIDTTTAKRKLQSTFYAHDSNAQSRGFVRDADGTYRPAI